MEASTSSQTIPPAQPPRQSPEIRLGRLLVTWTQPACSFCFELQLPGVNPIALKKEWREEEICAFCGQETKEGIYIRADPATVKYPKREKK